MPRSSERGAILLQVAIGLLVLTAFAGFAIDEGMMWVARSQAQHSADAGALAGVVAWAFDETADTTPVAGGPVIQTIQSIVPSNLVAGGSQHTYTYDWTCPPGEVAGTHCVRVRVYRNGENSSPKLPAFFMSSVGVADQGVKASATAKAQPANGTNCMKPWVIPDKFNDVNGNGQFDVGTDIYTNPGYTTADIDPTTPILLNPGSPKDAIAPSNFFQVDVNNYGPDITSCSLEVTIGETLDESSIDTAPGLSNGITQKGVADLTKNGPVTVVIGMYDPSVMAVSKQNGHFNLKIVNLMGFKIIGMQGKALYGYIVAAPGELLNGGTIPPVNAAFLQVIQLIR